MVDYSQNHIKYPEFEPTTSGPGGIPRWWRGSAPEFDHIRRLYVEDGHTEDSIAAELGVSRARVAAILRAAGVRRRSSARACPVNTAELRKLVECGATAGSLARTFGVSHSTAQRWLAEAGLLELPAGIDKAVLTTLYVDQQLTISEVAQELGIAKSRVIPLLKAAGIDPRPRSARRPRGARAAVTDEALREVYLQPGMTIRRAAAHFGVSTEYLRCRVAEAGLTKRAGSFTPHCHYTPEQLQDQSAALYQEGHTMAEVGRRLGVTASTVSNVLNAARVPVRGSAIAHADRSGRTLVDDLYADRQVVAVLRKFDVRVPDDWREADPFTVYAPLPLDAGLLDRLYTEVGLSARHIAMLCGVGEGTINSQLARHGITRRSASVPCPWNVRRRSGGDGT